jgi:hypothetical protein
MAHIFNIDGVTINPATEEKQDDIISALGGGDAVELATEDKQDDQITLQTSALAALDDLAGTNVIYTTTAIAVIADQTNAMIGPAAPAAGSGLAVHSIYIRSGALGTFMLHDDADVAWTGTMPMGTNDLFFIPFNKQAHFTTSDEQRLQIDNLEAGVTANGFVITSEVVL